MPQPIQSDSNAAYINTTIIGGSLKEFRDDALGFFLKLHKQYGDRSIFRLGPKRFHAIFDPELLKEVMVTKADLFIKSATFGEIKRFTGEGLVLSDGELHKRQRRIMQPRFTRGHIQHYAEKMGTITDEHLQQWKHGTTRELTEDLFGITFDIIAQTMFSFDSRDRLDRIGRAYEVINRIATEKLRALIRLPLLIPTKQNRAYTSAIETLNAVVYEVIAERRKQKDSPKADLLEGLMAAVDETDGTGMDDAQLRDELMAIFLAGHETTANTLAFALDYIMRHPHVEEKLTEEWAQVLKGKTPTAEDYSSLPFTQNVLWETLRLRPAGYVTGRTATADVMIGDLHVRKGESIMISPYPLHMSSTYFEDPHVFRPERFENDYVKKIPMLAYFPFGAGPRSCIGNHFAMLEMVIILAAIGQRFRLRHTPGHPEVLPESLLTLSPKGGIRVNVSLR